ncbi:MAG: corrinoid protein [Candidatus Adiutrix sp.]|jgi:5-methyltetrahydrofolate--homocysteine methyltransferase|nr:corrinoid protein [Candidatus Adiutrix sp.]
MAVKDVYQAVLDYDEDGIAALVEKELAAGTDVNELLQAGLISAMDEVGKLFSEGELYVPEMLLAAQTMKVGLEILKPKLKDGGAGAASVVVIGTVKGDLHDIGKNLVGMMLEGGGFEVHDLGVDVDSKDFVAAVKKHNASILGLSALLTTTMPAMEETVKTLREAGLDKVKIMIGGAPVTQAFADKIGADGYSEDAPGAVELARGLNK